MPKLDRLAKEALGKWPIRPAKLWSAPGQTTVWLRVLPKVPGDTATAPYLGPPSARAYKTRPDGMWIASHKGEVADVFCVEHCGSIQNLNDKRSRYSVFASSVLVSCKAAWFGSAVPVQGGGWMPRWEALGFSADPAVDVAIPVRYLRVLYSIPDSSYPKWVESSSPAAHEYFCRHRSFGSYNSQKMQDFLRRMSPDNQFYT